MPTAKTAAQPEFSHTESLPPLSEEIEAMDLPTLRVAYRTLRLRHDEAKAALEAESYELAKAARNAREHRKKRLTAEARRFDAEEALAIATREATAAKEVLRRGLDLGEVELRILLQHPDPAGTGLSTALQLAL